MEQAISDHFARLRAAKPCPARDAIFRAALGNRNTAILLKRLERLERELQLQDCVRAEAQARLA